MIISVVSKRQKFPFLLHSDAKEKSEKAAAAAPAAAFVDRRRSSIIKIDSAADTAAEWARSIRSRGRRASGVSLQLAVAASGSAAEAFKVVGDVGTDAGDACDTMDKDKKGKVMFKTGPSIDGQMDMVAEEKEEEHH